MFLAPFPYEPPARSLEAAHPKLAAYCRWERLSLPVLLAGAPRRRRPSWLAAVVLGLAVLTVAAYAATRRASAPKGLAPQMLTQIEPSRIVE